MGVIDGQAVSAAVTNPAFIDANADDTANGIISLANTNPLSGATITNTQRLQNRTATAAGVNETTDDGTTYSNFSPNERITDGQNHEEAIAALDASFNNTTGHKHTGLPGDGPLITASGIGDAPLIAFVDAGSDYTTQPVPQTFTDVSGFMLGKVASTGPTVIGVVTTPPNNRVVIRQSTGNENESYKDALGNIVYGRLTESAGVWTVSYFVLLGSTQTAYTMPPSSQIRWYFTEIYNPLSTVSPPPVYSQVPILLDDTGSAPVEGDDILSTGEAIGKILTSDGANGATWEFPADVEGDEILSTGEVIGKVLTSDGANGATWETVDPVEGTDVLSTGETAGKVLTSDGANGATWSLNAGGDVAGPVSSVDEAFVVFDGVTGKLIKSTDVIVLNGTQFTIGSVLKPVLSAYLGRGAQAVAVTSASLGLTGQLGANANANGHEFYIDGARGTGTGLGGPLIFRTAPPGSSGSTPNTLVPRFSVDGDGYLSLGTGGNAPYIAMGPNSADSITLRMGETPASSFINFLQGNANLVARIQGTVASVAYWGFTHGNHTHAFGSNANWSIQSGPNYMGGAMDFFAAGLNALNFDNLGNAAFNAGHLSINNGGKGLKIREGANCRMGVATLVAGTIVVATTQVSANSRIMLTIQDPNGGTPGTVYIFARTAGTNFTITSTNAGDTSIVAWVIIDPA